MKEDTEVKDKKTDEAVALYEKHIYDLQQMLEISRSLCTTLELSSLIESIVYISMAQMRALGAGVFTLENLDSNIFSLQNNYSGFEINNEYDYTIPTNSSIVKVLGELGHVCTFNELKEKTESCKEIEMLGSLKTTLIVPLILKNHINGILIIGERIVLDESSEEYSDYEKNEINTIGSLAAVAINNASLIEQSSTDMMTKLKLKYYFFSILTDKLDLSFSQGKELSVIMFDIDFFKKFNDTYGHACGDYVLQNVARIIKNSIRGEDIAARYGGEEFTVMLANTHKKQALTIAERIRKNIEKFDFFFDDQHMKVTISGGVSVFSPETNPILSAKILVDQADQALYISKRNGRNQITYADPEMLKTLSLEES